MTFDADISASYWFIMVRVIHQSSRSEVEITALANTICMYTAGGLWRVGLNYDGTTV